MISTSTNLFRRSRIFFALLSFFPLFSISQTITGSGGNVTSVSGTTVIVDNAINVTCAGNITDAQVLVTTNFQLGDLLSIDLSTLPGGPSANYNNATGLLSISATASAAEWQDALRTVSFTTTSYFGATKQITFTLGGAIYNAYNGHYYEYVNTPMSWTAGKAAAASRSLFGLAGYLATITTDEENSFLASKLQADGWIGSSDAYAQINIATGTTTYANQAASEGNWYWVTGPEKGTLFSVGNFSPVTVTYAHWNSGEPNNSGQEDYGQMYYGNNGSWNDLPNGPSLALVVEYGGSPGDAVVDLSYSRNIVVPSPTMTGNSATPGNFRNNNQDYVIDNTIHLSNISAVTDITVNISTGLQPGDVLDFDNSTLPPGVSSAYISATGTLYFSGTATDAEWNALLSTVLLRTNAGSAADRHITFNAGNLPASTEGHFYKLSDYTTDFYATARYLQDYQPELSSFNGLTGYEVNINSATENDFLQKKMGADFWLPLSDESNFLNNMLGYYYYNDQSESEGFFFWLTGSSKGVLVSSGDDISLTPSPGIYNNWQSGQPDNNGFYGNASFFNVSDGTWMDETFYDDDYNYLYKNLVIEYGGTPGDPVSNMIFQKTMTMLATLPVSLVQFDVKKENTHVLSTWTTVSERNNSHFILERGLSTQAFVELARINADVSSNGVHHYQFTDNHPYEGVSFYRLKQVDIDGRATYLGIRKMDFRNIAMAKLYPTLAKGSVTVQLAMAGSVQCFVMNAAGALVMRLSPTTAIFDIPVQRLPAGNYVVRIEQGESIETLKFIKE